MQKKSNCHIVPCIPFLLSGEISNINIGNMDVKFPHAIPIKKPSNK